MKPKHSHIAMLAILSLALLASCGEMTDAGSRESVAIRENALGTTYYVDPVAGNDANTGTSPAKPKKSIAGFTALGAGDTVILRGTGHYGSSVFTALKWSGTAGNPITVRSAPGETAVFDPGIPAFKVVPNVAWNPCTLELCGPSETFGMKAHPDEYISRDPFPADRTTYGTFLGSGDRLLTYERIEDLRANNESIALVALSDPRPGAPLWTNAARKYVWTYRGPGLWWNPKTKHIHFRASPTHLNQPGIVDYAGEADPRKLSLSISSKDTRAATIEASHITFKNVVFQNGGAGPSVWLGLQTQTEGVTFDHSAIHATHFGLRISRARFLKLLHCVVDSHLPSYVSRSDTKDHWDINVGGVMEKHNGTNGTSEMQITTDRQSTDIEIANCEFRNAHDSLQLYDPQTKVHHSLFENINDEVFSFQLGNSNGVEVHDNVVRKALATFSFSQQGFVTGARYIYRNILDNRMPTLGFRTIPPDVPEPGATNFWRAGTDFKMNHPVDEFYFYHNTIIQGPPEYPQESSIFDTCELTNKKIRRFLNNIHMTIQGDKPIHRIPSHEYPALSDVNDWFRRINDPRTPLYIAAGGDTYADFPTLRASPLWASFFNANGVGWDTHSQFTNPQFIDVTDYVHPTSVAYLNADYRLKRTSRARGAGVNLAPMNLPDSLAADPRPDIGAVPKGSRPVAVGVDGRHRFPDAKTPIAEAGDYITVTDTNHDGFETIGLDGTGSSDPDGSISSYTWTVQGQIVASGATASVVLPVGDHHVLLTVRDRDGRQAIDMRQVTIKR